jgi:hypothetical protein
VAWRDYAPKKKQWQGKLADGWLLAVNRFIAMYSDVDMGEITPQMVRNRREKLPELPVALRRRSGRYRSVCKRPWRRSVNSTR